MRRGNLSVFLFSAFLLIEGRKQFRNVQHLDVAEMFPAHDRVHLKRNAPQTSSEFDMNCECGIAKKGQAEVNPLYHQLAFRSSDTEIHREFKQRSKYISDCLSKYQFDL